VAFADFTNLTRVFPFLFRLFAFKALKGDFNALMQELQQLLPQDASAAVTEKA
jgi:hypothetical protein